ncbi:hypothetical protein QC760_007927 [Botrytis cinerea]
MNWTGGRLQRHSRKSSRGGGGGGLTKRQKEHFAKVKANLRSGSQKNVTTKWTIFDKIVVEQPHVRSLGSHIDSVKNSECGSRQGGRNEVGRGYFTDLHKHNDLTPTPKRTEAQEKHANNRSSSVEFVQRSPVADDDLYNATPPPLRIKREHAASSELRDDPQDYEAREAMEQSMEERRRNLLSQKDWVGLNIHHLPKLKFNQPRHDEDIGRRRKVKDGHRARYSKLQTRISSPFASRKDRIREQQEAGYMEERLLKNDVRISIGGRIVPPGISSSSRPKKVIRQSTPHMKHLMLTSDHMLLDDEYIMEDQEDLNSDRFLSAFEAKIHGNGDNDNSARTISLGRCLDAHGTHGSQEIRPTPRRSSLLKTINKAEISHESWGKASPFSRTAIRSICDTSMKQPMPTRPAQHPVLRLSSPKCNSSVLAQVGGSKSVFSEDQLVDNEMWKAWMPLPTGNTERNNYEREEHPKNRNLSISPGVSVIPTVREKTSSSSRSNDEDSGGKYEHSESWGGCESSMTQEQSTTVHNRDWSPSDNVDNISSNDMPHSSDVYDQFFSSDRCELGNLGEGPLISTQYRNQDNTTIKPQDKRSPQRTSSSIPWNPPRSSSPGITRPFHSNFVSSPCSKVPPIQQTPTSTRQTTEFEKTALQHNQIPKTDQNLGIIEESPTKGVQRKVDQNELWMKFVFDEASEEKDAVLRKTTSTGFELEKREPSPAFSTFVHNSVESESPLQPRYVTQANSRITWQDPQQGNSSVYRNEFGQSSNYSTIAYQSSVNHDPVGAAARNKSTPHPLEGKHHQTSRDSGSNNRTSAVDSTNFGISNSSTSSSPKTDSLSMVAVSGSQINTSTTTTTQRSFLEPHCKVIFTKPQPFIGSKSEVKFSSPDRTIRIGRKDLKKQMSSGNSRMFLEEIEDD